MKKIFTLIFILTITFLNAQELKHCGTTEALRELIKNNPEIAQRLKDRDKELKSETQNSGSLNGKSQGYVYVIPVVFHIVHNYGAENISDAQVIDAVRILNEDFRKLNADTSDIVAEFKSIAADAEIEFRLANTDPSGMCTNGIDRIVSSKTYTGDDAAKLNAWPYDQYLNIWTVESIASGAAGYSYYPGYAPAGADGVMILADYVGSIGTGNYFTARALTHEVGHWLNLAHVWGSTNNPGVACGNDGIGDTPFTKGWTSCNLGASDVCNAGIDENIQNYMEYAYCSRMYTEDQKTAMRNALQGSLGGRNNLWTSGNHSATGIDIVPADVCAPHAEFKANYKMVCEGSSVKFTDLSWNATPNAWTWTFPGGTPSSSSAVSPTVVYNTAGTYDVTLEAFSSGGSEVASKTSYILVSSPTGVLNAPYSDGFETAGAITAYNPNTWIVNSGDNIKWARSTAAAASGSGSIKLSNFSAPAGDVDEIISNSYNLTTVTSPTLTFDVAYAQKLSTNTDKLRVLVSVDCGKTWTQRYSKSGSTLKTIASTQSTNFTPTAAQWRQETVGISGYSSSSNVRFKFEFTGASGNNIFIDNINIGGIVGINAPDQSADLNFSVYPNPIENNSLLRFALDKKEKIKITITDITGRIVSSIADNEFSAGDHEMGLDQKTLKPGMYFVNLMINNRNYVKKIVIKN
jgi:PKD repeat protein